MEDDARLFFPATERNREPIAATLKTWLPDGAVVLEVASGSGEHALWFQRQLPGIHWQTSDPDPAHRRSISAWIHHPPGAPDLPDPLALNVESRPWSLPQRLEQHLDAVVAINLIHIAPWSCCQALIAEAAGRLCAGGALILYGPFRRGGHHTSDSNAAFDQSLRARDPRWGVRDLEAVEQLASNSGLTLEQLQTMPANNLCLLFRR